jgi:uracil-DNA glycosylase family 4
MMSDSLSTLNNELLTCRKCARLVAWREEVARTKRRAFKDWDYWGKPVPGFGDPHARVFVVGLAPAAHGSNRTGRPFTGDGSGAFLYPALYRAGFASQPDAHHNDDGLTLTDLYIASVCRCAPPANKPLPDELANCQPYLVRELDMLRPKVVVALGRIAFERILRIYGLPNREMTFAHAAVYPLNADTWLVCSYHPSQQNTLTGKLTAAMFDQVWQKAKDLLAAKE